MTITISVIERKLTDGSEVYDVLVGSLYLPAVTRADADALADKMSAAIEAHTNEIVTRDF